MHVFLFDIDGTLIHSGGAGQAALHEAMRDQFGVQQPERVPVHGCTDRSIASNLFKCHGISDTEENWQRFCQAYLAHLPRWLASKRGRVLPGVPQLLERLRARSDVTLGLLTGNIPRGARIKLEYFGLYDHFAFGGYGDRHLDRVAVAEEAMAAARRHLDGHVVRGRTVVVGDTPHDIRCARAIGAGVVAVATGFFSAEELARDRPDLLLDDLAQPDRLLDWVFG